MSTVVIRPRALADFAEIWAYIAEDSPYHADALAARINREFRTLSRRPLMGRSRPELADNLRSLAVSHDVIFYIPRPRGIEVIRVLHGARDLESQFRDEQEEDPK